MAKADRGVFGGPGGSGGPAQKWYGHPVLLVIGLDCAPPSLVFDRWAGELPHLSALRARGRWGPLRSTQPPITVPAWASMTSGRDPGELGLYGFRNRTRDRSYDLRVASSADVRVKRVWDRLSESGKRVAVLFVPLTSPPTPVRGTLVGCFLGAGDRWAFPPARQTFLEARFGPYLRDVADFRTSELERVLDELDAMRTQHFAMARALLEDERPDFLMMVEMGPDRLHHAMWQHMDPEHARYEPGNPWEARALAYYRGLDAEVGALVERAGPEATVLVVSDHGARAMKGGVALNEHLLREGWLALREEPSGPTPLRDVVDWSRTRAWAEGGYYARVFLNVQGREPQGVVPPERVAETLDELERVLGRVEGVAVDCRRPERVYRAVHGQPPELMVYLDDLAQRALGTVGHGAVRVPTNDHGPDGCNHDWDGIAILAGPGVGPGRLEGASILDVAPTVLDHFGVAHELPGRSLAPSPQST